MIGDVGKIIFECRTAAGLSQRALGKEIGTYANTISQYEHKGICPKVYMFEDILNACGYEIVIQKIR